MRDLQVMQLKLHENKVAITFLSNDPEEHFSVSHIFTCRRVRVLHDQDTRAAQPRSGSPRWQVRVCCSNWSCINDIHGALPFTLLTFVFSLVETHVVLWPQMSFSITDEELLHHCFHHCFIQKSLQFCFFFLGWWIGEWWFGVAGGLGFQKHLWVICKASAMAHVGRTSALPVVGSNSN